MAGAVACSALLLGGNRPWAFAVVAVLLLAALLRSWELGSVSTGGGQPRDVSARLALGGLGLVVALAVLQWVVVELPDPMAFASRALLTLVFAGVLLSIRSGAFPQHVWSLLRLLTGIGAVYGFVAAAMTLLGRELLWFEPKTQHIGSATGFFVSRNNFAGFMALCLCAAVGLMIGLMDQGAGRRRRGGGLLHRVANWILSERGLVRFAMVIMVIALVLSRSRMGNVAFLVAVTAVPLLYAVLRSQVHGPLLVFVASVLAIDTLLLGSYFGADALAERLMASDPATEARDDIVPVALSMWMQQPWIGHGAGGWAMDFPGSRPADLPEEFVAAHNDYLQFLVELGLVGFIGLAVFVLASAARAVSLIRRSTDPAWRAAGAAALMAIVYMCVHATVDFNLQIPGNALLFVMIIAPVLASRARVS